MGLTDSSASLLARARLDGAQFASVLTLGRQSLRVTPGHMTEAARALGAKLNPEAFAGDEYADGFLKALMGAGEIRSLDCSDFEGCDLVHDLNLPVDDSLRGRFDAVIDGGALEHVFNFPVALANCMEMVAPGGRLFISTMANNHLGHGFYQFSPELFFRAFTPENGYEIQRVLLEPHPYPGAELTSGHPLYEVADPAEIGGRVRLVTKTPVKMHVDAVRVGVKKVFETWPIQSDYSARHEAHEAGEKSGQPAPAGGGLKRCWRALYRKLPAGMDRWLYGRRQLHDYSFANRRMFREWRPF